MAPATTVPPGTEINPPPGPHDPGPPLHLSDAPPAGPSGTTVTSPPPGPHNPGPPIPLGTGNTTGSGTGSTGSSNTINNIANNILSAFNRNDHLIPLQQMEMQFLSTFANVLALDFGGPGLSDLVNNELALAADNYLVVAGPFQGQNTDGLTADINNLDAAIANNPADHTQVGSTLGTATYTAAFMALNIAQPML